MKEQYNSVDLFAGAGGITEGMKRAGFRVVMATDIDHHFSTIHRRNHPDVPFLEKDITQWSPKLFRFLCNGHHIHVVSGGPPCQGFSMNGSRKIDDPRNELFKHYVKILKILNPEFFFMENVPGMLSLKTNSGEKFITYVMREFKKLKGYAVEYRIVNMADYGVPQTRRRLVIIGNRLGIPIEDCIPKAEYGPGKAKPYEPSGRYIMDLADVPDNLVPNHRRMNHSEAVVETMKLVKEGEYMPKHIRNDSKKKKTYQTVYRRVDRTKPAPTMVPGHMAFPIHPTQHRSLTVREAARIQTFPDNYVFGDKDMFIPTVPQGLAVGNAVPPLFAEKLGRKLLGILSSKVKPSKQRESKEYL
jgi:DNA (cytosine-5)-methyltransferase 1